MACRQGVGHCRLTSDGLSLGNGTGLLRVQRLRLDGWNACGWSASAWYQQRAVGRPLGLSAWRALHLKEDAELCARGEGVSVHATNVWTLSAQAKGFPASFAPTQPRQAAELDAG
eukprot:364491-Chlamydomonas_euryale.AAC.13